MKDVTKENRADLVAELRELQRKMQTCKTNALRFYDDSAEVSEQWRYHDEYQEQAKWIEAKLRVLDLAEMLAEKES